MNLRFRRICAGFAVAAVFVLAVLIAPFCLAATPESTPPGQRFDGQRAYEHLKQICALGPRISGSEAMLSQQEMLKKHFTALGGQVELQKFSERDPRNGQQVEMANLIVHWHPESTERLLLCAHYDTRPQADNDPDPKQRQEGLFLGANDGGSGAAVLAELGQHMKGLPTKLGVDFVLFDGEEFVFSRRDRYFRGSEWFAKQYAKDPPKYRYVGGVLLDMVGDAKLSIFQESHSAMWPGTNKLVKEIWGTAARLGVTEFIPRVEYSVDDDHIPLNRIAHIPVCDVIDFQYPDRRNSYWHTTADIPENCSAGSLGKVGWVLQEWLATK